MVSAELEQVASAIRDFERRAAGDEFGEDAAFQEAWDRAIRRWWELVEVSQGFDDERTLDGNDLAGSFLNELQLDGDVFS